MTSFFCLSQFAIRLARYGEWLVVNDEKYSSVWLYSQFTIHYSLITWDENLCDFCVKKDVLSEVNKYKSSPVTLPYDTCPPAHFKNLSADLSALGMTGRLYKLYQLRIHLSTVKTFRMANSPVGDFVEPYYSLIQT